MKFHVLTLFPEMFEVMKLSIIGRAQSNQQIEINTINIRDFSTNKHHKVDDYPYGGGAGMVMQAQPIIDAVSSLNSKARVIYLTPKGKIFNQSMANELAEEESLILLCGHYEGVDQRAIDLCVTDEISIGDYVLTGGELPAMVLIDALSRLNKGVLGKEVSFEDESHYNGLLEYAHYTRPAEVEGLDVPEVLLSGHHQKIEEHRMIESLEITKKRRPDMFMKWTQRPRSKAEEKVFKKYLDKSIEK